MDFWLSLYALLLRGMPRALRSSCGDLMLDDLRAVLDHERTRRGRLGVWVAGAAAVMDLTKGVLRERWVAAHGYHWERGAGSGRRMGRGEKTMMWMRELRLAFRSLLRRPGFTSIATLTLGLGIGATVAIFTIVNAVVLQPLPFPESDRIVEVRHHAPGIDLPDLNNSPGTIRFYRQLAQSFDELVALSSTGMNLMITDRAQRVGVALVEPSFFSVLRTQPQLGRAFTDADVVRDANGPIQVALLTAETWRQEFGADPGVVGRTVLMDQNPVEIIGVMPSGFYVPEMGEIDMIAPMWVDPEGGWGQFGTTVFARLSDPTTFEAANAEVMALQQRVPEQFPNITAQQLEGFGWSASLRTLKDAVVGEAGSRLLIVMGTVGFVLLIACANVANLFLVRAESRQKELAVRAAMGANRSQVAGGFLSESVVLGAMGGLTGMAIAWTGLRWLTSMELALPRVQEVAITPTVLGFAGAVSVMAALFLGVIPMVRFAGGGFAGLLRDGGRTATDGRVQHRARNLLVMAQLALGLVLLVGSGLLFRSLQAMQQIDLGFDPENTLAVTMSVGQNVSPLEAASFYQSVVDRASGLPGVVSAGFGTAGPLVSGDFNGGSFNVEGENRDENALPEVALWRAMGPGYMESLGIQLVEGRAMTESDWRGGTPVVWVNRWMRDNFLEGEALGKRISWEGGADDPDADWAEIVGVFENTKESSVTDDPGGFALLPMYVDGWDYPTLSQGRLFVRGADGTDVTALAPLIRELVAELNPNVPITETRSMEAVVSASMADRSITMTLLGIATTVALFLGTIGLFGVISYVVGQRRREIGVRMALGAEGTSVTALVIRQGAGVIVGGVAVGLLGAFALTRVMGSLLYEVSATDPVTFVGAGLLLLTVSLFATWLPARRAARMDPVEALRAE